MLCASKFPSLGQGGGVAIGERGIFPNRAGPDFTGAIGDAIAKSLMQCLWQRVLHLPTGIRRTMKSSLLPLLDKLLLRKGHGWWRLSGTGVTPTPLLPAPEAMLAWGC